MDRRRKSRPGAKSAAKSRPARKAQEAGDLPTLEPVDDEIPTLEADDEIPVLGAEDDEDLPTLEAAEDGPLAAVEIGDASDPAFDVQVTIELEEMEKKAVPAAIEAPLRSFVHTHAARLRWRRVVVEFAGETLVPSAANALVADIAKAARPALLTVRRGFGDETVLEETPPSLTLAPEVDEASGKVRVALPADVDAADVALLLPDELARHEQALRDRAVELHGLRKADPKLHDTLRSTAISLGSKSFVVAREGSTPRVLYDRDLEATVRVETRGDREVEIAVERATDDATLTRALMLALERGGAELAGRDVTIATAEGVSLDEAQTHSLLKQLTSKAPTKVRVRRGDVTELAWPPLVKVAADLEETTWTIVPNGRSTAAMTDALAQEFDDLAGEVRDRIVTVDFPDAAALTVLGDDLLGRLERAGVRRIAFTTAGDERTPMWPAPLSFRVEGGGVTAELDTEAGKPVELLRAIERAFASRKIEVAGKTVTIRAHGASPVSRKMTAALVEGLQAAAASAATLEEGGTRKVLFPSFLEVDALGNDVAVQVHPLGRDLGMMRDDAAVELEELLLPDGARIVLDVEAGRDTDAVRAMLVDAFSKRGVSRIEQPRGDGTFERLWPSPIEATCTEDSVEIRFDASALDEAGVLDEWLAGGIDKTLTTPGLPGVAVELRWPVAVDDPFAIDDASPLGRVAAALVARGPFSLTLVDAAGARVPLHPVADGPLVSVLGRRDSAKPPLVLLAIERRDDPAATASVGRELRAMREELAGRQVLVVFRKDDTDVEVPLDDEQMGIVRRVLAAHTATLWCYLRARGRKAFVCLASRGKAIRPGTLVKDPRPQPRAAAAATDTGETSFGEADLTAERQGEAEADTALPDPDASPRTEGHDEPSASTEAADVGSDEDPDRKDR